MDRRLGPGSPGTCCSPPLLDAGASPAAVSAAVDAVVPGEVDIHTSEVIRTGLRARDVQVVSQAEDHPRRSWADIRALLTRAELVEPVRERALAVFTRLAEAEGRVHGIPAEDAAFGEVGAWDSTAEVVGVCAALHCLDVCRIGCGPVALGSGHVRTAHGQLPIPVPAVLELALGREVSHGGRGELATPTGMAILAALASETGPMPAMRVDSIGIGAGSRDVIGRANVVRVVRGAPSEADAHPRTPLPDHHLHLSP